MFLFFPRAFLVLPKVLLFFFLLGFCWLVPEALVLLPFRVFGVFLADPLYSLCKELRRLGSFFFFLQVFS